MALFFSGLSLCAFSSCKSDRKSLAMKTFEDRHWRRVDGGNMTRRQSFLTPPKIDRHSCNPE
jgi:hypothetical protein